MSPFSLSVLLGLGLTVAGPPAPDTVKEARRLATEAERYAARRPMDKRMFKEVGTSRWLEMSKEDGHLTPDGMWDEKVSNVAYVWIREGRTLLVSLTAGSPSGDWTSTGVSVFRRDGTLARHESTYAAFSPVPGRVVRETVWSSTGRLLASKTGCTTLEGGKKLHGTDATTLLGTVLETTVWKRVRDLPFGGMLGKRPASGVEGKVR
ncbi:MAG: hypothetical protein JST30_15705 [Armatimonadetes bacterium]|nr:hypothetical protein [Armatimonadota bacterium]